MIKNKEFLKELETIEAAVEFAEKVGGKLVDTSTVKFMASYYISKPLYDVKRDSYKVYLRVRPLHGPGNQLSYCVYAKASKEAMDTAREKVQRGVI